MMLISDHFVYDPTEPENQQWDTVYALLIERETKQHLMRLLLDISLRGATGPLWLSPEGEVQLVFN